MEILEKNNKLDQIEKKRLYNKEKYQEKRESILESKKKHYTENKEKRKKYYQENKKQKALYYTRKKLKIIQRKRFRKYFTNHNAAMSYMSSNQKHLYYHTKGFVSLNLFVT